MSKRQPTSPAAKAEELHHLYARLKEVAPNQPSLWNLRPCWTEKELKTIEADLDFTLPEDYRAYLAKVGDGGAGYPYDDAEDQGDPCVCLRAIRRRLEIRERYPPIRRLPCRV